MVIRIEASAGSIFRAATCPNTGNFVVSQEGKHTRLTEDKSYLTFIARKPI